MRSSLPPSPPSRVAVAVAILLFLIAVPSTGLAQTGTEGLQQAADYPWQVQSIASAAFTLVVGGLLIAVSPDGTRRRTDRALEEPAAAFGYGLASLIAVMIAYVLLLITVVGIIVAIPMLLVYVVVALIAGEYGYLAVGRLASDSWPPALALAVLVAAMVGVVPVLGTLVAFVITTIGMGTVVMELV